MVITKRTKRQSLKPVTTYSVVFGQVLKRRRSQKGVEQSDLARVSDIHPSTLSRIERGGSSATLDQVARLARALRCKPQDLLQDTEDAVKYAQLQGINVMTRKLEPHTKGAIIAIGLLGVSTIVGKALGSSEDRGRIPAGKGYRKPKTRR